MGKQTCKASVWNIQYKDDPSMGHSLNEEIFTSNLVSAYIDGYREYIIPVYNSFVMEFYIDIWESKNTE
jgi:hypothetical protein